VSNFVIEVVLLNLDRNPVLHNKGAVLVLSVENVAVDLTM
jgi:hypothetical protein